WRAAAARRNADGRVALVRPAALDGRGGVERLLGRLDAIDDAARGIARIRRRPQRALVRHGVEIAVRALLDVAPAPPERHEQRVAPLGLRRRLIERDALQRLAVQRAD